MKKNINQILIVGLLVTGCSYNPVIDTAGRSGTFQEQKAVEITNDVQHCRELADEHTIRSLDMAQEAINMYVSYGTLGIVPRRESTYKVRVRKCLEGRGHSVLN